jgi:sec-independent protein translocase protein TatC
MKHLQNQIRKTITLNQGMKEIPQKQQSSREGENVSYTFFEHLDEFRSRFMRIVGALFIAFSIAYFFIDPILIFVTKDIDFLVFTAPTEAFTMRLILAFVVGTLAVMPYFFFQIWQFVGEGLKEHEKQLVKIFFPISIFLFCLGVMFAYFVVAPFSLQFLLGFSSEILRPMITIKSYVSFLGGLLLGCGVIFELPLVLLFLAKIGIATPEFLRQKRRHAVIIILVLSAFLTPPDAVSLLILSLPLILLYECGILAVQFAENKKTKQ